MPGDHSLVLALHIALSHVQLISLANMNFVKGYKHAWKHGKQYVMQEETGLAYARGSAPTAKTWTANNYPRQ